MISRQIASPSPAPPAFCSPMRANFSKIRSWSSFGTPLPLSIKSTIKTPFCSRSEMFNSGSAASQYFRALAIRLINTCPNRSGSVFRCGKVLGARTLIFRSVDVAPACTVDTARFTNTTGLTVDRFRLTCPFSSTLRSSKSSKSRVNRDASP